MNEELKKKILEAQSGNREVLNNLVLENKGLIINIKPNIIIMLPLIKFKRHLLSVVSFIK